MLNFCYSPLMVDVAYFSCDNTYDKNVGICFVACFVWIIGCLCVGVIGRVYDGLVSCVYGCFIWVAWRFLLLQLLGLV